MNQQEHRAIVDGRSVVNGALDEREALPISRGDGVVDLIEVRSGVHLGFQAVYLDLSAGCGSGLVGHGGALPQFGWGEGPILCFPGLVGAAHGRTSVK